MEQAETIIQLIEMQQASCKSVQTPKKGKPLPDSVAIVQPLKTKSEHLSEFKSAYTTKGTTFFKESEAVKNVSSSVETLNDESPKKKIKGQQEFRIGRKLKGIRLTQSLDLRATQNYFVNLQNKTPQVTVDQSSESIDKQSDDDLNVKELMNHERDNLGRYAQLLPLEDTESPKKQVFNQFYRQYGKLASRQTLYDLQPNVYSKMNKHIQDNNLIPRTMHLVHPKATKKLNLNYALGGQHYISVLGEGLSSTTFAHLKSLSLKANNLNARKLQTLCDKIPTSLTELNVSQNRIDKHAIISLNHFLNDKTSILKKLNLENNRLADPGTRLIFESLNDHKNIATINLSKNGISDRSVETIAKYLRKTTTLLELYLHYNQITCKGGLLLFKGIQKNQYLKVFDISFNKLGTPNKTELSTLISQTLGKPHPELLHIDLSYNGFSAQDAKIISEQLIFNNILYGFHFEGNAPNWKVNSRGYLVNQEQAKKKQIQVHPDQLEMKEQNGVDEKLLTVEDGLEQVQDPEFFRRIDGVNCVGKRRDKSDMCWICEGWQEVKFKWTRKSGSLNKPPIFIHLDFDEYRPCVMAEEDDYFYLYRMCPPDYKVKYFFSNPFESIQCFAQDQKYVHLPESNRLRRTGVGLMYADGTFMQSYPMSIINYLKTGGNNVVIDESRHYTASVFSRPREAERIVDIDPNLAKERHWSIENSLFKDYDPDSEGHIESCFEYDFECGKFFKYFKEDEDVKECLKKVYKHILACYQYYASLSLSYEFPVVNQISFMQFISQTRVMQRNLISNVDLDITYLSAYVVPRDKEYQHVQDKCLVRYQFLDIIIRLAREQYVRTGICTSLSKAIEKLFEVDQVLHWVKEFGVAQEWRNERYWTQYMDMSLKLKLPFLKSLFRSLCTPPKRFITPQQFYELFRSARVSPAHISEQEIYLIFLQSMMTQVDELNSLRHVQMSFLEFLEGLCRVAEKVSPSSPFHKEKYLGQKKRRILPLFVKFEGLAYILYYRMRLGEELEEVVNSGILQTKEARKMGIYEEKERQDDQLSMESNASEQGAEEVINKQLLFEDELENWNEKSQDTAKTSPQKQRLFRRQTMDTNSLTQLQQQQSQLKQMAMRNIYQKELNDFYSANIMKKIEQQQHEVDAIEELEIEASSPVKRQQIVQSQISRATHSKLRIRHQPTFNFESQ